MRLIFFAALAFFVINHFTEVTYPYAFVISHTGVGFHWFVDGALSALILVAVIAFLLLIGLGIVAAALFIPLVILLLIAGFFIQAFWPILVACIVILLFTKRSNNLRV